ncbi:PREDICTED: agouti-related protein-like [Poecilia mexicana]|uniref:Agouti domain-containing protein n=1 Tax=Poecilia mexicana TaxID=48701 RepID=A0A3B3Z4L8_9TELE|nr:PREDICTED: agouti-related protein-like [Poecilia mexicana]XP_014833870.1 PREDICTED: agouti-related protein-like [Poecilia mexicana]
MFGMLMLCCASSGLLRPAASLVHGGIRLDDTPAAAIRPDAAYLADIDRGHAPSPLQDGGLLPVDSEEDRLLMEAGSNNEDSSALQLQGRAVRSPRRCIPHQQFCLGYSLPCCDPCDTCYCRFYNAICYCRPVGHTCPQRPT